jgi:hypothetical protein
MWMMSKRYFRQMMMSDTREDRRQISCVNFMIIAKKMWERVFIYTDY